VLVGLGLAPLGRFDELSEEDIAQMHAVTGTSDRAELRRAHESAAAAVEHRWREVAPGFTR
jgi:hypothetical protein